MKEEKQRAWKRFEQTGSIAAYLDYCMVCEKEERHEID